VIHRVPSASPGPSVWIAADRAASSVGREQLVAFEQGDPIRAPELSIGRTWSASTPRRAERDLVFAGHMRCVSRQAGRLDGRLNSHRPERRTRGEVVGNEIFSSRRTSTSSRAGCLVESRAPALQPPGPRPFFVGRAVSSVRSYRSRPTAVPTRMLGR
jgi:hypothetical protein